MENLSRNEKIIQARKSNKSYKKNKTVTHKNKISPSSGNFFQLRLVAASLLFLIFLGMKETNLDYHDISYETIMEIVGNNSGMEAAEEKIISAFNRLD